MTCCDAPAKIGELRTLATVQAQQKASAGGGATAITYAATGLTLRGKFEFLSGSERLKSERLDATTRARFTCRYNAALKESDRLVIAGRAYQIRFIDNWQLRNRWMTIDLDGGVAT